MPHYIIFIYIYIYTHIYIYIWAGTSSCPIIHRWSRYAWSCKGVENAYGCCRECLWMSWRSLCIQSLCCMIVSIRFAILHLFLYASLYPPASVPSPRGRSTCVSVFLTLASSLHSAWDGCPCGGEGGGIQRAKVCFLEFFGGIHICFFH
jgi:hypothetical protein